MDESGVERLSILQNDDEGHGGHSSHSTSSKDSIRRIPDLFKMHNEKAYTPYKYSIGPWHYGKTELLRTGQKLKESSLEGLLARFIDPASKRRELEEAIHNVHNRARECYEGGDVNHGGEDIDVAGRELEEILLLDGCFIIELFCKNAARQVPTSVDVSLLLTGAFSQIFYHDLLLPDNQIPWFVLECLFDKMNLSVEQSLVELALKFFEEAFPHKRHRQLFDQSAHNSIYLHLVHFVWRMWVVLPENELLTFRKGDYRTVIPSATRLKAARVRVRKITEGCILDAKFAYGVLKIGPLLVTPLTKIVLENLIIFEQYSIFSSKSYVTCYAMLLDCLIDTSDDMNLMSTAKILDSRLNPKEMVNFFSRVRDNLLTNNSCYARLCHDVNEYCNTSIARLARSLTRINEYYSNPAVILSTYIAVITLVFTIMQVYSKK